MPNIALQLKTALIKGGSAVMVIKVTSAALKIAIGIVLARTLGPSDYGVYAFIFALISILAIPAQMGLPHLIIRETAKAHLNKNWAAIRGLWRASFSTALLLSIAITCLAIFAVPLFGTALASPSVPTFYWGLALIPIMVLGNLRGSALSGLRHVVTGQLPEFIIRPFLFLLLAITFGAGLKPHTAMMFHTIAAIIAFAGGSYLLTKALPNELRLEEKYQYDFKNWGRSALAFGLVVGAEVLNENAGLIALGIIGTPPQVAQFRVAFQGAALVAFGLLAINTLVAPYFSRLYSGRNIEQLSELIKISARISFSLAVLATTLFIIFGERIIKLMFGSEYDAAYLPLVILSFGQLVNAFCGPVHHLLYMTGKEREVLICVAVATSMTVALSILLIPSYGESGAAAALSITLCGMNVILALRARALLGIDSTAMGRPARIIEKGA